MDGVDEFLALLAHELVYEAVLDLYGRGEPADAVTVACPGDTPVTVALVLVAPPGIVTVGVAMPTQTYERWVADGLGIPDFYDSLMAFQPQQSRVDGIRHLVVFPMYTQNGSTSRLVEAVLIEVIWPEFISELEAGEYSNKLFVPIRFIDFTPGYDTNSAVLFPETVAMRQIPTFTWGAIFADREAARFRRVVRAAAEITKLELPADAAEMLEDQTLTEETFVMWDLIHDRTHMRGDLPFDPFMIKQRMPFFLYSLEELRCDLTAFRESVAIERRIAADDKATDADLALAKHAKHVQYAVIFDRIFRFAITGSRVRNYDGLGGQLLFAWLHQNHVLHWTDTTLTIDWEEVPGVVIALGEKIQQLYWSSIDRPKIAHWLAAYELVSSVVEPHPVEAGPVVYEIGVGHRRPAADDRVERALETDSTLQAFGLGQLLQDVAFLFNVERTCAMHRLQALLNPALDDRVGDVHEFCAHRTGVRITQGLEHVAQRHGVGFGEVGVGGGVDLVQICFGQTVESRVQFRDAGAFGALQRVQISNACTQGAVRSNHGLDRHLLHGNCQVRCLRAGQEGIGFRTLGEGLDDRSVSLIAGAVAAVSSWLMLQLIEVLAPLVGDGARIVEVGLVEFFDVRSIAPEQIRVTEQFFLR